MSAIRTTSLIALMLVVAGPTGQATPSESEIPIDWHFAGSFLQNLARVAPAPASPTTIVGRTAAILLEAKGSPGPATIRVANGGGAAAQPPDELPPPPAPENTCDGLTTTIIGGENGVVATLKGDLSLLYGVRDASLASYSCTDASGVSHGVIYVVFLGGTERFAGAMGRGVITFEARPVVAGSVFLAETGALRGSVRVGD